jgi:hypothetical protein
MKFHPLALALLLATTLFLVPSLAAPPATAGPGDVVHDLYKSAQAHFGFSPESVKAAKPWVSAGLYAKMLKKVNEPVPKGDAPDIEGDLFLDSQDPPDKFEVGKADIDGTKARVPVTLIWPSEQRHQTVDLEQIGGAWKVTEVVYGKDGKLTDLLKK